MRVARWAAYFVDSTSRVVESAQASPGDRGAPGVRRAAELLGRPLPEVVDALGNGSRVTAQDTVAFTCWVAATHLDDYPAAVRACVEAGGDVDTTAAIVGGIVAAYTGVPPSVGCPPTGWPPGSRYPRRGVGAPG